MTRVAWIEFRRGASAALLATTATAVAALLFHMGGAEWAGSWSGLAQGVRESVTVVGPITLTFAAWHASRERRRRIVELVDSTSRPRWARLLVSWGIVAAGAGLGLILGCLPAAVLVGRAATYTGGFWWLLLLTSLMIVVVCAALGFAVGRLIPGRVTAPIAAIVTFLVASRAGFLGWDLGEPGFGEYLPWTFQAQQVGWFLALIAGLLVLSCASRRWFAAFPAAAAAVFALPVAAAEPHEMWQEDPAALERVCAGDQPEVCVIRENAFVLDELVSAADSALAQLKTVPGAADTTIEVEGNHWSMVPFSVEPVLFKPHLTWSGSLAQQSSFGSDLTSQFLRAAVPSWNGCDQDVTADRLVHQAVLRWAGDPQFPFDDAAEPLAKRLKSLTADAQRAYVSRYLDAVESCDARALKVLAEELR